MATYLGEFQSLSYGQWKISVETVSGSDNRTLTLAADPLTIEMDDSDDMLTPVRLTTGYLRVVGYDADLYPTMGSQHKVLVSESSTSGTHWRGYIQPQAYDIDVKRLDTDVYELPVECPLSALAHIDLPVGSFGDYPTFGTILKYIMMQQGSMWNYVYMPSVTEAQNVLSSAIDRRMLVERDASGNEQSKYSCLEFIEEFCKFFGYCCRYDGNGGMLFFRMFKQQSSYCYVSKDYLNYGWLSSSYFFTAYYSNLSDGGTPFDSTNQRISLIQGFRKVRVDAPVEKASTVLFEMPNNWLLDYMYGGTTYYGTKTLPDGSVGAEAVTVRPYEYSFSHDGWQWYFAYKSLKDNFTLSDGVRLILLSYSSEKTPSMQWKPVIEIADGTSGSGVFKLTSQRAFAFTSGLLVISGTTYTKHDHVKYTGNGNIWIKVGIGGYYYNLSANGNWHTNNGFFGINVGVSYGDSEKDNQHSSGEICSNLTAVDSRVNYNGGTALKVNFNGAGSLPVNRGIVEFEISAVALNNAGEYGNNEELCIEDLKIEFLPDGMKNVAFDDVDEAYTYSNGSYFREERSISVAFASDKYKIPGENSLYTNSGRLVDTLPFVYGGVEENEHPEYFLVKYASIYGQRTHQILDIEVDASVTGWVHPLTVFTGFEPSGKTWWVVSVDKDFGNNRQRIRAIEL